MPYLIENGMLVIVDEELGLELREPFDAEETRGPNSLCYYKDGLLHGPSTFFAEKGTVLAKSWWCRGKQQGKARYYYPSGALYSVERYKSGLREGLQEYFYEEGAVKSVLSYVAGKLHGPVKLYGPNGQLKRECLFDHGKKTHDALYIP